MKPNAATKPVYHPLAERLRRIEGRHNSLLKALRAAFAHGDPTPDGFIAIEGLRIVEEAIRSGLRFRAVFFGESATAKAEKLLPQIGAHVETFLLPDKLFASAVPSESPQGVAALVRLKDFSLVDLLSLAQNRPLLAIAGIQDPGNLGTMLRSAEAFETAGVLLGEGTVSPLNPKVVRASAGSLFRVPFVRAKLEAIIPDLQQRGFRLMATSSHKGTPLHEADLTPPLILFVGGEGAGVPRDLLAKMNGVVAISHSSKVESLNAGVAASILLYEASKRRQGGET